MSVSNLNYCQQSSFVKIPYLQWLPENKQGIKAVAIIIHGMAEHAGRYNEFATYLAQQRIATYAIALRGHKFNADTDDDLGVFAAKNGWFEVLNDIKLLIDELKTIYSGKKIFILGHSMGSFFARSFMIKYPGDVYYYILSGTSYQPLLLLLFGKFIAKMQWLIKGYKHKSKILDFLSFGAFSKAFKPRRTKFDWLTRDENIVDAYISDKYCGFVCSTSFFYDLLSGIQYIQAKSNLKKIAKETSVLIVSGTKDVVGNFTKGTDKVIELFKSLSLKQLNGNYFENARHEILNEVNRIEVYDFILCWINERLEE